MKGKYKSMLMALTTFLLLLNVVTFLGLSRSRERARAQAAPVEAKGCRVQILSPRPRETVGPAGVVEGIASIPDGTRLWVLTRRKGTSRWRPQGGGPARIDGGHWSMRVEYGGEGQRGQEFHLAAAVVNAGAVEPAPTRFPETVRGCEIQMVAVRRGE